MRMHDRFLRAPQLVLLLLVCLVVGSLEVVLLRTYVQIRATSEAHARDAQVPLNFANVQREVLMLEIAGEDVLHGERADVDGIRLRSALLTNQLHVAQASVAGRVATVRALGRLGRQAEEYARLLLVLESPVRPEQRRALERRAHALGGTMAAEIKRLYDREEYRSIVETGEGLAVQRRTGLLLLAISGLLLILAGALAWSLWRRMGGALARLAEFAQLNPAPLLKLAGDGSVEFYNSAAERLARDLTTGMYDPLLPDDHAAIVARSLRTGERERHEQQVGERTLAWSFFPIASQSAVHCYGEDVTERHALEEQLRQSQKLEAIGHLAGGVAHDFNNLLTAIRGYGELVLPRLSDGEPGVRRSVEEIVRTTERAAQLTRQLLAFGRKQVLEPEVVDANAVVAETTALLRRLLGAEIDLGTELAPAVLPVFVDRGQMEQVLVNLAVNARDAMPLGGSLTIETRPLELDGASADAFGLEPGSHVALVVRDTGVGMDAETRERVFEPFFTTKEVGKGTGLGLATAHGIVRQNGGAIMLRSEPGRGAEFTIYLPTSPEPPEVHAPDAPLRGAAQGTGTILLVEDEDVVRALIEEALTESGYTVLAAATPASALEIAVRDGQIDLLVTDLAMPGMGGRALSERVLALHPAARIVYISGYRGEDGVEVASLETGRAFLQKPFSLYALREKVGDALGDVTLGDAAAKLERIRTSRAAAD